MIAHDLTGHGPPVLLLHAGVADRRMWARVAGRLGGHRLVLPDLRGFGAQPVGLAPYTNVGDLLALLDGLGIGEPVIVCGNSYGGGVALELAARAPERVARVVAVAPAYGPWPWSEAMRRFGAEEAALLERGDRDGAVELNVRQWAGELAAADQELVRDMQRRAFELQHDARDEEDAGPWSLAGVRAPVRLLVGTDDVPDFVALCRHLARELPRATLEEVPGAGHLLPLSRPEQVARAIAGHEPAHTQR